MDFEKVSEALAKGGSVRAAARLLGKSLTSVQWWILRNGYRVEVEKRAFLVPIQYELTEKAKSDLNDGSAA